MLAQIITENGQKKIIPLTADAGAGNPVGSYLYLEKKSNPQGYLYCDGSTFDETVYPLLYAYLGNNVLPDWREFSAVGAEQNTTNVYDAQTNPSGVIHDHDVFTQGESKDDQLQNHNHSNATNWDNLNSTPGGQYVNIPSEGNTGEIINARKGTVTRGKRKAVFIYIKATSGLTENQQENVLNTINENNSYSTEEHATGKKWIDGKDIWSKTYYNVSNFPHSAGLTNVDEITKIDAVAKDVGSNFFSLPFITMNSGVTYFTNIFYNKNSNTINSDSNSNVGSVNITLEYTKTT